MIFELPVEGSVMNLYKFLIPSSYFFIWHTKNFAIGKFPRNLKKLVNTKTID